MEPIRMKFGTPQPLSFREHGEEATFEVRVRGSAEITAFDSARYGDGEDLAPLRRALAGAAAVCLAGWPGDVLLLSRKGAPALADMLRTELALQGITAEVTVESTDLTEESGKRYNDAFGGQLFDAAVPKVSLNGLEDAPHGVLKRFSYNVSSHGMMAGSSSWGSDSICWNDDGSITLTDSSHGGGADAELVYSVRPEDAEALRSYVADAHLAALSKVEPPIMGFDNITTVSFSMTFDDSALGGSTSETVHVNCGMAGMFFRDIENELRRLIRDCRERGECLRSERKENAGGFVGFMGMMQTKPPADLTPPAQTAKPRGVSWACPSCGHTENYGKFCVNCGAKRPEVPGAWTCPSCGFDRNSGRFCANCGARRP